MIYKRCNFLKKKLEKNKTLRIVFTIPAMGVRYVVFGTSNPTPSHNISNNTILSSIRRSMKSLIYWAGKTISNLLLNLKVLPLVAMQV